MSPVAPPPPDPRFCPRCGAELDLSRDRCWLCDTPLLTEVESPFDSPRETAPLAPSPVIEQRPALSFSLASLMMLITLASVVMGVTVIAPGVGIPLGIILLVVWIRTSAVARRRLSQGIAVSRQERTHLFMTSLGLTTGLIAVLGVTACIAFVAACFAGFGTAFGLEQRLGAEGAGALGLVVFGVVALAIAVPVLWWASRVSRRRWLSDTQQANSGDTSAKRMPLPAVVILVVIFCLVAFKLFFGFLRF